MDGFTTAKLVNLRRIFHRWKSIDETPPFQSQRRDPLRSDMTLRHRVRMAFTRQSGIVPFTDAACEPTGLVACLTSPRLKDRSMNISTLRFTSMICAALLVSSALAADPQEKSDAASADTAAAEAGSSTMDPACEKVSEDIMDALIKGDYVQARQAFNADMMKKLPEKKLQEAWESLFTQFGVPKMRGEPQGKRADGLSVIYTPLKFEKGNLVSQVACDANAQVAGFYVVPEMPPKPAENKKPVEY